MVLEYVFNFLKHRKPYFCGEGMIPRYPEMTLVEQSFF